MTGPIQPNIFDRELDKFVESPTRANKTAIEVVVGNASQIGGGGSSSSLEVRNASETISALKCVYSQSANDVAIAQSDVDLAHASVFGITIVAVDTNESTQIQTQGTLRDSSFVWQANTQLYVSTTGSLTDVAPVTGYRTLVATAQGPGQIFINIQEPITL